MTKRIQAMLAAVPAIPLKPSTPAISAMIKKVIAQPIMLFSPVRCMDAWHNAMLCTLRLCKPCANRGRACASAAGSPTCLKLLEIEGIIYIVV